MPTSDPLPPLRLAESDNVAVALAPMESGVCFDHGGTPITLCQPVPSGHKIATVPIQAGQNVIKYGQPIGIAKATIQPGEHVHVQNLADHHLVSRDFGGRNPPESPVPLSRQFEGFHRADGRVGTRNYVALVSTVNCSASVCQAVASKFDSDRMKRWPNVDGVFAATHTTGCAIQYHGTKHQMLGRVLAGYANHANVGACLVIGLGCEQTTAGYLGQHHGLVSLYAPDGSRLTRDEGTPMLVMQNEGGTRATIAKAELLVEDLLDRANACHRSPADASHLTIGVECGGSDGYSGLTANPAVGVVSDRVIACGGSSVISETTELYGAEHLLVQRSRTDEVAGALIDKIDWWKHHVSLFGGEIDNNPSVGNKAGGLTTITEKSLGAVSKSGSTSLEAVLDYAEPIRSKGLVVMDSPGFDPSSVTGKVAGGCNLVLFTTGRGSCFGCKPVPVIKIASNTPLFESMPEDMDLNAGSIVQGESLQACGERIFEHALDVASGRKTCSEKLGMGDHEFIPWTVGPVL